MAASAAARFPLRKVGRVAVGGKHHITGVIGEYRLLLRRRIIDELVHLLEGAIGRLGLFRGDGAERHQHGAVDRAGVIKEGAQHLLDIFLLIFRNHR